MGCSGQNGRSLAGVSRSQVQAVAQPQVAAQPVQAAPMQNAAIPVQPAPIPAQAAAPVAAQPAQHAPMFEGAGVGEQKLDTAVGPSPVAGSVVLDTHNLKTAKVKTPSDEKLPKWVPVKGRLSVVDSSDLAENLGLVPKGATKKSDQPISVAEKLAEESASRKTDPMTQGSSWSYAKAGRFRSRR